MYKNLNPTALGVTGHQSEIIELALSYGFQGIELAIAESVRAVKAQGVPYARRLLDSAGIRAGLFRLPVDLEAEDAVYQQELGRLTECGEVAVALDCTRCVALLPPASDRLPYHENFECYRRRLREICQTLDSSGIQLGIGFHAAEDLRRGKAHEFIHDLNALLLLVEMVGASNLGIVLDVWDLYVSAGNLEAVDDLSAQQIVAVNLADLPDDVAVGEVKAAARLLPGTTGRIDSARVLATLAEKGYDGPVTPKPARVTMGNAKRQGLVREAGAAMAKLWQAAGLPADNKRSPLVTRQEAV